MTGVVIKTGITSPLSLSLNTIHAPNSDMWMLTHIILRSGGICLLLNVLALCFLHETIEIQTEGV